MYCRAMLLQFKPGSTPDNLLDDDIDTFNKAMKVFVEDPFCPQFVKSEFKDSQKEGEAIPSEENDNDEVADNELSDGEEEENEYPELFPGDISELLNFLQSFEHQKIIFLTINVTADKTNDPNRNRDIIQLHEIQREIKQLRDFQNDVHQDAADADSETSDVDDNDIQARIFIYPIW